MEGRKVYNIGIFGIFVSILKKKGEIRENFYDKNFSFLFRSGFLSIYKN